MDFHLYTVTMYPGLVDTFSERTSVDNHENATRADTSHEQILSDELLRYLSLYVNTLPGGIVALFGTISNIVNLTVFHKMKLKDSMTVCLFALSFTDFLLSFMVLVSRVLPIWDFFFPTQSVNLSSVNYILFAWMADALFSCSGWITAYLSMERCICVTFPFKVKQIFSRKRSILAIICIYLVNVSIVVPIFATNWLEWVVEEDMSSNKTTARRRLIGRFSENRREIEVYLEIISYFVLPIPSMFIITIAVCWMVYGLKASTHKRQSMTSRSSQDLDSKMSSNTRRLVKVVLTLTIVFIICSIPRLYAVNVGFYNPEVDALGKERNLNAFSFQFARFVTAINASVNIFVYLKINSSYRATFRGLFVCCFENPQLAKTAPKIQRRLSDGENT